MSARVVVVHGPADAVLEGALRASGLVPVSETGGGTVWAVQPREPVVVEVPAGRRLLTITEAARSLGLGRSTLYELIGRDQLEVVHVGRAARIPVEALDGLVERLRTGGDRRRRAV